MARFPSPGAAIAPVGGDRGSGFVHDAGMTSSDMRRACPWTMQR
jgi:hypothetical protein